MLGGQERFVRIAGKQNDQFSWKLAKFKKHVGGTWLAVG